MKVCGGFSPFLYFHIFSFLHVGLKRTVNYLQQFLIKASTITSEQILLVPFILEIGCEKSNFGTEVSTIFDLTKMQNSIT